MKKILNCLWTKMIVMISITIILFSCNRTKNPLEGNWFGFEEDSTYYELYINDTIIVLNHENIGPIGYDYSIKDSLLFVSNAAGIERVWLLELLMEDYFTIKDSIQSITYYRMEMPVDFFKSINDSISYSEFKKEFTVRYNSQNSGHDSQ